MNQLNERLRYHVSGKVKERPSLAIYGLTPLQEAFRFHLEHGGYSTPPGRAQCALNAARAELRLRDRDDLELREEPIQGADMDPTEDERAGLEAGSMEAVYLSVYCGDEHLAGCGMIVHVDDRDYRRVLAAELAAEAFYEEER